MTIVDTLLIVALPLMGFVFGVFAYGKYPGKAEGAALVAMIAIIVLVSFACGMQAVIEYRWYDKAVNGPVPVEAGKK